MVDVESLRTASLYINNQLLSRGLLRDGQNIDFTRPGDNDEDVATTMGRIMAVVNDLILRRDVSKPIAMTATVVSSLLSMLFIARRRTSRNPFHNATHHPRGVVATSQRHSTSAGEAC